MVVRSPTFVLGALRTVRGLLASWEEIPVGGWEQLATWGDWTVIEVTVRTQDPEVASGEYTMVVVFEADRLAKVTDRAGLTAGGDESDLDPDAEIGTLVAAAVVLAFERRDCEHRLPQPVRVDDVTFPGFVHVDVEYAPGRAALYEFRRRDAVMSLAAD